MWLYCISSLFSSNKDSLLVDPFFFYFAGWTLHRKVVCNTAWGCFNWLCWRLGRRLLRQRSKLHPSRVGWQSRRIESRWPFSKLLWWRSWRLLVSASLGLKEGISGHEEFKASRSDHAWLTLTVVDSFVQGFDKCQSQLWNLSLGWLSWSRPNCVLQWWGLGAIQWQKG